jgi:tetratricopeptide (TPR) repeat protein
VATDRSANDLLAGSLTEGWRALDFFTDRFAAIRRFAAYLNDDPAPNAVLFFHGNGGNGKSLLLRHLRSRCCQRLSRENWEHLAGLPDDELAEGLAAAVDAVAIPEAAIDFGLGTEDVVGLLQELRRGLAPHGLKFPLFTFACVQYWQQSGELNREQLQRAFPDDELSFAVAVADTLGQAIPFASLFFAVKRLATRHFGPWFDQYRLRRGLDETLLEAISRLDHRTELVQKLPVLFAEDLNVGMGLSDAPARVVLCFDTYERFWGDERAGDARRRFDRDAWFRRLLTSLDRSAGIVTVVAGREPPDWRDVPDVKVSDVELVEVGDFADADARAYLVRAAGGHEEVHDRLLDLARVGPDRVHPFLLGLVVDIVEATRRTGVAPAWDDLLSGPRLSDKRAMLVHRFLRYVDDETAYAVRALAACRAFDFATYRFLGTERGFQATRPRFEALIQCSFVRRLTATSEPSFRLHELLRRLLADQHDVETLAAHAALERRGRDRAEEDAVAAAEATYHANQIDRVRGIDEWVAAIEQEWRAGRYDRCRALIDVAGDLVVPSDESRGRVAYWVGQYATALADYPRAEAQFRQALDSYEAAIAGAPDEPSEYRQKAATENALGNLLTRLGRYDEAGDAFERGVAATDGALVHEPLNPNAHGVRGALFQSLGNLHLDRGLRAKAEESFRAGLGAFDRGLAIDSTSALIWNNKGGTHLGLAMLMTTSRRFGEAVDALDASVAAFDRALDLVPGHVSAATNRAIALSILGDVQAELAHTDEAIAAYRNSSAAYDEVLTVAPDSVSTHLNRGATLQSLGELLLRLGQDEAAADSLRAAIAAQDEALARASQSSYAHGNKGASLAALAGAQERSGEKRAAIESLRAALTAFDAALSVAPDLVDALVGKANALEDLASLLAETQQGPQADSSRYRRESRALSERASSLAPDRADVRATAMRLGPARGDGRAGAAGGG